MSEHPLSREQIEIATKVLKEGRVVVFPTDTVYGIGSDPFIEQAVSRIYRTKQRPHHLALPLLLSSKSELGQVAGVVPDIAWLLAERFWPGALTLIVRKSPSVPSWVSGGGDKVAVRIPDHPITLDLIRSFGKPLVGTSANISGSASPVTAEDVRQQLGDGVDFILDGGRCPGGIESTVVDITGSAPVVLREGAVSSKEIKEAFSACSGLQ